MKTRIITSVVGLAVLALVLVGFNTIFFDLVLAAIALIGFWEVFVALGFGKKQLYLYAVSVPYAVLIMLTHTDFGRMLVLPASLLLMLFYCVCLIAKSKELQFTQVSAFLVFSGIILLCFYSLAYLKRQLPVEKFHYDAVYFIMMILGFAWGGDSAAYFAGRFFGKHKMAPVVSPKKTWEGAVGGVLGSILIGMLITWIYGMLAGRSDLFTRSIGPAYYVLLVFMGAGASVLGILGDLFASVVKRQEGIKDYGKIFPGHGGVLDRFDSVMFIAPFVSLVVRYTFYYIMK